MITEQIAEVMGAKAWVGIPCAGGMAVLQKLQARTMMVADKHRMVINLAYTVAWKSYCELLIQRLLDTPFHPDALAASQAYCLAAEPKAAPAGAPPDLDLAYHYFVAAWMGRSGVTGTEDEFTGKLSSRWTSSGGDSNKRFRSAVTALESFSSVMERCSFSVLDIFEFLACVADHPHHGLYIDVPWPKDGDKYKCKFTKEQQDKLALELQRFQKTRVVLRFGVHPETDKRYPEDLWRRVPIVSRTQGNNDKAEMLLVNRCSDPK
jgi:hypothetical protein